MLTQPPHGRRTGTRRQRVSDFLFDFAVTCALGFMSVDALPMSYGDVRTPGVVNVPNRIHHAVRHAPKAKPMNEFDLDLLQWPAMVVTVAASWLVASKTESKRNWGFWVFMLSNVLWVAWGVQAGATALIVLQICLAVMNIRGARKTKA